jgi:hypothetical protein
VVPGLWWCRLGGTRLQYLTASRFMTGVTLACCINVPYIHSRQAGSCIQSWYRIHHNTLNTRAFLVTPHACVVTCCLNCSCVLPLAAAAAGGTSL